MWNGASGFRVRDKRYAVGKTLKLFSGSGPRFLTKLLQGWFVSCILYIVYRIRLVYYYEFIEILLFSVGFPIRFTPYFNI